MLQQMTGNVAQQNIQAAPATVTEIDQSQLRGRVNVQQV
jgi:hypothetical protein